MNYMDKVSKRIVELREERGETQQELADAIGITRQSLSRYEIAARTINVDVLGELAKHFDVSADYLLGLSDVKSTEQDMKIACEVTGLSEKSISNLASINKNPKNAEINELIFTNSDFIALLYGLRDTANKVTFHKKTITEIKNLQETFGKELERLQIRIDTVYDDIELQKASEEAVSNYTYYSETIINETDYMNFTNWKFKQWVEQFANGLVEELCKKYEENRQLKLSAITPEELPF